MGIKWLLCCPDRIFSPFLQSKRLLPDMGPFTLGPPFLKTSSEIEGLISEGVKTGIKKTVSKRAIAVLIEIRFSFTGF